MDRGFSTLRDPVGAAISAIEATISDDEKLGSLAGRSYVHVNGFEKLFLESPIPDEVWTIHVWRSDELGDIHDHRWDFSSAVLTGSLAVERFMISERGFPGSIAFAGFRHTPLGLTEGYKLETSRSEFLTHSEVVTLTRGAHYEGLAPELHRVHRAHCRDAMTLFRRGPVYRWETRVFRDVERHTGPTVDQPVRVRHYSGIEFSDRLSAVRTLLVSG